MLTPEGLGENLRFLVLEVLQQLDRTAAMLADPSPATRQAVRTRDDYIDTLRNVIQRKVFRLAASADQPDGVPLQVLRAVDTITANLERCADFCLNVVEQTRYVTDREVAERYGFEAYVRSVRQGLELLHPALETLDVAHALRICKLEDDLDKLYEANFRKLLKDLARSSSSHSLVTTLLIARYFERMGDSLLNMGEAIISAALGERIKIGQYFALSDSLDEADDDDQPEGIEAVDVRAMGESRSGCRIDAIAPKPDSDGDTDGRRAVIFKEGNAKKLREERDSIERWHELFPGVAPQIYAFQDGDESAALLFEFLRGRTFEDVLLTGEPHELERALDRVVGRLTEVWAGTRRDGTPDARYMGQLRKRLPDVFAVHKTFRGDDMRLASVPVPSFEALVDTVDRRVGDTAAGLRAPFSVRIHGDCNVDNLLWDPEQDHVRFIDLHRSRQTDYVQDVSVFIVSNLRLQVFDEPIRRRIHQVVREFRSRAAAFAREQGDATFEARLALGLARSFATSTRFVLRERAARAMFLRSRYLLERLAEHGAGSSTPDFADFVVPEEALVV